MSPLPNENASNVWQNFEVDVSEQELPNLTDYQNAGVYLYGICLILIPTATILGNLLVIVSVLRFRALHSSINFLILGLAVADLFVALFVMPYAVYVYMQGGFWFLGPLMCDIYSASDVACSTASILLLAVISFDRYRAVSRPIQYSRQSQNIRRVIFILLAIWLISLALASPIVLGVNDRPDDASPYECRLYNPEFSILSSMVSFVIPCFVVLFVYIRIMIALRRREKAARLRRLNASQYNDGALNKGKENDEVGEIVAGPAVNVMMLALPSMTKRIRRYERHKAAVEQAGDENIEIGVDDELDEDDEDVYDGSDADLIGTTDGSVVESNPSRPKNSKRRRFTQKHRKNTPALALVAPQALSLTSFLPILGAAAATVGTPSVNLDEDDTILSPKYRKRRKNLTSHTISLDQVKKSLIPRPHSAMPETLQQHASDFFFYPTTSESHLTLSARDQQYLQNRETIWNARAKFFRSTSGPALLDAKSPLMLRRFVLDPANDPEPNELVQDLQEYQTYQKTSTFSRTSSVYSLPNENDLGGSSTPRSATSSDSLSENLNVVTNDFLSEGPNSFSRISSDIDYPLTDNMILSMDARGVQNYRSIDRAQNYTTNKKKRRKFSRSLRRRSLTMPTVDTQVKENHVIPSILRHLSRRSPRIFRNSQVGSANENSKKELSLKENTHNNHFHPSALCKKSESMRIVKPSSTIFENPSAKLLSIRKLSPEPYDLNEEIKNLLPSNQNITTTTAALLTTTLSRSKNERKNPIMITPRTLSTGTIKRPTKPTENCSSPLLTYSSAETSIMRNERESTTHTTQTTLEDESALSDLATTAASAKLGLIILNDSALDVEDSPAKFNIQQPKIDVPKDEFNSPTVTFNIAGKTFTRGSGPKNGNGLVNLIERRRSSIVDLYSDNKPSGSSVGFPSSLSSNVISSETDSAHARILAQKPRPKKSISHNNFDIHGSQFLRTNTLGEENEIKRKVTNPRINGGPSAALALKLVKKSVSQKDGSSLKRKVTKAQRKEKRATKTLGIVVGVFLICWVPFFTINILNGVCVRFNFPSCQVGFDIFFYATWVGYMNSFMNPVIYTIFNTEFRRAFKSLILGRNAVRRHRARHV